MTNLSSSNRVLFLILSSLIIASGCVQNSSNNVKSNFNFDYQKTNMNNSGLTIHQDSISSVNNVSNYSFDAENRLAMNLPAISVTVNMTSNGVFEQDSYKMNSSGTTDFNIGGNSNPEEFETQISSQNNSTTIETMVADEVHRDENSSLNDRKRLGISMKALQKIDVRNASVLGTANLSGEENILLELKPNKSDLIRNSEQIFQVHSTIQDSSDEGQDMSEIDSFDKVKAYLWTGRENHMPSKFAYYGSAGNGSIQVRSVTNYR